MKIWYNIKNWLWSIFGNDDEPTSPSWYVTQTPNYPTWFRNFVWLFLRNPLHNLFFYKWSIKDKTVSRYGDYPYDVFNPKGGWNRITILLKDKTLKYFKSYIGDGFIKKFYCGYREKGNWGFKITFNFKWFLNYVKKS